MCSSVADSGADAAVPKNFSFRRIHFNFSEMTTVMLCYIGFLNVEGGLVRGHGTRRARAVGAHFARRDNREPLDHYNPRPRGQ
jgi:hypothetical protein